jgi:hypothetical protein
MKSVADEYDELKSEQNFQNLRERIDQELTLAGFIVRPNSLELPQGDAKNVYRKLHSEQRLEKLKASEKTIRRWEDHFIHSLADIDQIDLEKINPVVRPVDSAQDRGLFNYASLTWSVPVSKGFGRRTYFLVEDEQNGKLIGIFALGDPVYNLSVRDKRIGWDQHQKAHGLYNVFDAFVCGSIDPYRQILGGKLIAMMACSDEVVETLREKYHGRVTNISKTVKDSRPALITVTSALGRSSIYNRLKFNDRYILKSQGYTKGFGHFQFSPQLFADLLEVAKDHPRYSGAEFGAGANWKIRTLRQALFMIGASNKYIQHGLTREVFMGELATNTFEFLRGETGDLDYFSASQIDVTEYWKRRWLIPRSHLVKNIADFDPSSMRLSNEIGAAGELRLFKD